MMLTWSILVIVMSLVNFYPHHQPATRQGEAGSRAPAGSVERRHSRRCRPRAFDGGTAQDRRESSSEGLGGFILGGARPLSGLYCPRARK
jgi:hypothetical protein